MTAWLIPAAFVVGYALCWRPAAHALLADFHNPDSTDYVFASILASLLALVWPVWIIPALCYRAWGIDWMRDVVGETEHAKSARLEREARDAQRRIQQLERELEIR